jgi:predicted nucleotidyltransferase
MSETLKAILLELKTRFQEIYGDRLVEMILYGSQARGDAEVGSDIDVLVVLRGEVNPVTELGRVREITFDLSYRNDTVVSCMFIDEAAYNRGIGPYVRNVQREGIRI